eukprot:403351833
MKAGVLALLLTSTIAVVTKVENQQVQQKPTKFLQTSNEGLAVSTLSQTSSKRIVSYNGNNFDDDTENPFADFIIGIILICFSFPILWNNERKQVRIAALLIEGEKNVVDCQDYKQPETSQDMKLIYASGQTQSDSVIVDEHFGVQISNSVKLIRSVEMFQWVEHKKSSNNRTETSYTKEWKNHIVNSSAFRDPYHQNPHFMPFDSKTTVAEKVDFGGYVLAPSQISKINTSKTLGLTNDQVKLAQEKQQNYLNDHSYEAPKESGGSLLISLKKNNGVTDIGDVKVTFSYIPCGPTTIVAQQICDKDNFTFRQWNPKKVALPITQNNYPDQEVVCLMCACCPCATIVDQMFQSMFKETIEFVEEQPISKVDLFKKKSQENDMTTVYIRIGGWFLMYAGICLLFSPIIYTLSWIPLVGFLMAHGFKLIVAIFAFVVSVTLSSLTIGIAWLYYRPLYGAAFLGIVGVGLALIFLV